MKNLTKLILVNLVIFAIGALIIELVWRISYAKDIRFSVNVLADTQYSSDVSALYKTNFGEIYYSRDKYGFRGNYGQVEDIDIIAVGGSTTDQRYLDNEQEWGHVLANNLVSQGVDITIVNAGVDGQSSFGHIKNFDLWFNKIDSLKPKYILFYIGVNDFYIDKGYSYDQLQANPTGSVKEFVKSSFPYYVYRLVKGITSANTYGIGHKAKQLEQVSKTSTPLLKEDEYRPLMKARLDAYFSRLEVLVKKTKQIGAMPIFVTQKRANYKITNNKIVGAAKQYRYEGTKFNGVDQYHMDKLLNQTTMSICELYV